MEQNEQMENTESRPSGGGMSTNTILLGVIALLLAVQTIKSFSGGSSSSSSTTTDQATVANANGAPISPMANQKPTMANPQAQTQPETPPVPTGPPTTLKYPETAHDFGKVKQDTENHYVFKFTNTGINPLTISDAKGSCGCTVPSFPKDPIPPGGQGEIQVVYKPGKQKGPQTKTVTVTANTNPPQSILTITADVQEVPGGASTITPAPVHN